jgi:signal transduction histidine kinase
MGGVRPGWWTSIKIETFPLAPLIADVVKTVEPLAAKNGNQLVIRRDGAIGWLHADSMRLRQALLNLMSNANKFTERGMITVDARIDPMVTVEPMWEDWQPPLLWTQLFAVAGS